MKRLIACAVSLALIGLSLDAGARERTRRRFDPDDLELDEPGVVHADISFGVVRGENGGRWLVPDFDVDLGLSSNVELGLDGSWAVEGSAKKPFSFDHRSPDNLWINTKIELYVSKDEIMERAWAFGVQLGPRAAVAPDSHGTGFETLLLLGYRSAGKHIVFNAGGLVDSGGGVLKDRPSAVLTGVDGSIDLDEDGTWSIAADLGGVFFFTPQKHQLVTTFGPVLAVTKWLDVSVNGLIGFLGGGDHYGGFLQISPKIPTFK